MTGAAAAAEASRAFWAMGGYARFVWPCFALAFAVLVWNLWAARRYHAQARRRAQRALAMSGTDS